MRSAFNAAVRSCSKVADISFSGGAEAEGGVTVSAVVSDAWAMAAMVPSVRCDCRARSCFCRVKLKSTTKKIISNIKRSLKVNSQISLPFSVCTPPVDRMVLVTVLLIGMGNVPGESFVVIAGTDSAVFMISLKEFVYVAPCQPIWIFHYRVFV